MQNPAVQLVLVLNAGSSSIKYQLLGMPGDLAVCKGLVERIGEEQARVTHVEDLTYGHRRADR